MVNRAARQQVLATIDDYLNRRINAFVFDERLFKTKDHGDRTVRHTVYELWFFYDDFIDHEVNLSREAWDYLQRLRLLLTSEAEWTEAAGGWNTYGIICQVAAVAGLAGFAFAVWWLGIGWLALGLYLAVGAVWLAALTLRGRPQSDGPAARSYPFESIRQIRQVRRSAPGFNKERYPKGASRKPLRSPARTAVLTRFGWIVASVYWPLFCLLWILARPRKHWVVVPKEEP